MPTRIFCGAGCAAATPHRISTPAAKPMPDLEAIDPLLRVDPLLQPRHVHAARLRALPRVVRFLRLAEHVVHDAEIDERLRRIAAERLELVELVLAEVERCAIHRDAPLLIGGPTPVR